MNNIRYRARCDCTKPDGEVVQINSTGVYPAEHYSEANRHITWLMFEEMVKQGGPWGWEIGGLSIESGPDDLWDQWYRKVQES